MLKATLLLVIILAIILILFTQHATSTQGQTVYVVKRGDTLWGIAKELYGEQYDARKIVYRMMDLNGIEDPGQLQPGMEIYLPIAK
jgi:nucleoid-associated protein YgaU